MLKFQLENHQKIPKKPPKKPKNSQNWDFGCLLHFRSKNRIFQHFPPAHRVRPTGQICVLPMFPHCAAPVFCHSGQEKINNICVDVDECLHPGMCPEDSTCVNLDGGFTCVENIPKPEENLNTKNMNSRPQAPVAPQQPPMWHLDPTGPPLPKHLTDAPKVENTDNLDQISAKIELVTNESVETTEKIGTKEFSEIVVDATTEVTTEKLIKTTQKLTTTQKLETEKIATTEKNQESNHVSNHDSNHEQNEISCTSEADPLGLEYLGTKSTTKSGSKCKNWKNTDFQEVGDHDYCRNPQDSDNGEPMSTGPWCFLENPSPAGDDWMHCNLLPCSAGKEDWVTPRCEGIL